MITSRTKAFRVGVFTVSVLAAAVNTAIAAQQTADVVAVPGSSTSAQQLIRAKNNIATAMSIANRFSAEFKTGPNGTLDPNRVQLINNLLRSDAHGMEEAAAASTLQQAMVAANSGAIRRSNTTITTNTQPNALGDSTDDLVYTPITPCRIVDTRPAFGGAGGALAAQETRTFSGAGGVDQGGAGTCSGYTGTIPAALALNVTADATGLGSPSEYGFVAISPAGIQWPLASWLNLRGGETVANEGIATINPTNGNFNVYTQTQLRSLPTSTGISVHRVVVAAGGRRPARRERPVPQAQPVLRAQREPPVRPAPQAPTERTEQTAPMERPVPLAPRARTAPTEPRAQPGKASISKVPTAAPAQPTLRTTS